MIDNLRYGFVKEFDELLENYARAVEIREIKNKMSRSEFEQSQFYSSTSPYERMQEVREQMYALIVKEMER